MRGFKGFIFVLWVLLPGLMGASAWAHGTFPESEAVVWEDPQDPLPLVWTTFGILIPRETDDWDWVCEEVTGGSSGTGFAVLPSGTWFISTVNGLFTSADRCQWEVVPAFEGWFVTQVASDPVDPRVLWVATASGDRTNALWRSQDGGKTFDAFGDFGEMATVRGFRLNAKGTRIIAVGWRDSLPYLWRWDGVDWEELLIEGAEKWSLLALGVDAQDPGTSWIGLHSYDLDRVVSVSSEGVFTARYDLPDVITAFATGPQPGQVDVGGRNAGWAHSDDGGQNFTDLDTTPEAGCFIDHDGERWFCTNNWADGAAVFSGDSLGEDLTPRLLFGDVHGVLECPAGSTTQAMCEPLWEAVRETSGLDVGDDDVAGDDDSAGDGGEDEGCGGCDSGRGNAPSGLFLLGILGVGARVWRRFCRVF